MTRPSKAVRLDGTCAHAPDRILNKPLSWVKPRRILRQLDVNLFHDDVEDWKIAEIYGIMIAAHHLHGHVFQWLTKRSARARTLLTDVGFWDEANGFAEQEVMDRRPANRRRNDARATLDDSTPSNPRARRLGRRDHRGPAARRRAHSRSACDAGCKAVRVGRATAGAG